MANRRDILALIAASAAFHGAASAETRVDLRDVQKSRNSGWGSGAGDGQQSVDAVMAEAEAFLLQFLDPAQDHAALTASLEPTAAEIARIFKAPLANSLTEGYGEMFAELRAAGEAIGGKPAQTELLLWGARLSDIRAGGPAMADFPGGYRELAGHVTDGGGFDPVVIRWKFVEPGAETGMAFDGLWKLDGRWVLMPKPWRALD